MLLPVLSDGYPLANVVTCGNKGEECARSVHAVRFLLNIFCHALSDINPLVFSDLCVCVRRAVLRLGRRVWRRGLPATSFNGIAVSHTD